MVIEAVFTLQIGVPSDPSAASFFWNPGVSAWLLLDFCGNRLILQLSSNLPNNFKGVVNFFSEIAVFPYSCDHLEMTKWLSQISCFDLMVTGLQPCDIWSLSVTKLWPSVYSDDLKVTSQNITGLPWGDWEIARNLTVISRSFEGERKTQ